MADRVSASNRVQDADIELAHELATLAAATALPYVATAVAYDEKGDGTPVSAADLAVEAALIDRLRQARPHDGILSEECGEAATGRRRWILDPIDGTASFVAGGADWGTHVALEVDDEIVLGIITRPLQEQRWWAARGHGAFTDDDRTPHGRSTPLSVTNTAELSGAHIGLYSMGGSTLPRQLVERGGSVTETGSHILELVEGRLDAIVSERCGYIWDHAPAVVLTTEAGGQFTDPSGGCRPDRQGGIYSNGWIHDQLHHTLNTLGAELGGSAR